MDDISYNELKKLIDNKGSYILIDVRESDELAHGMIPSAKHIEMDEFLNSVRLPSNEFKKIHGFSISKQYKLILYCRSGNRSAFAAKIARDLGFNAINYPGSILEWSKHDKNVKEY